MKERPILMSEPMVLAILSDSKIQTRRICPTLPNETEFVEYYLGRWQAKRKSIGIPGLKLLLHEWRDRYGQTGDRLWVKETFWTDRREPQDVVIYAATPAQHKYRRRGFVETESEITTEYLEKHEFWNRRPSIFMWRWASRLTLEIKSTRVERLHDITDAGALREGVEYQIIDHKTVYRDYSLSGYDPFEWFNSPRESYRTLWDQINGRGSWAKNPWVEVISFKRV